MTETKKGRKSWKPADRLRVDGKIPGYVLRWVDKESGNYAKRVGDGYVPISGVTGAKVKHDNPDLVGDGKPITSLTEYRNMELMAIPEEDWLAHREYFAEETRKQTASLRKRAEQDNASNAKGGDPARVYGKTIIE